MQWEHWSSVVAILGYFNVYRDAEMKIKNQEEKVAICVEDTLIHSITYDGKTLMMP